MPTYLATVARCAATTCAKMAEKSSKSLLAKNERLRSENQELRLRLDEAEQALEAIRTGQVESLVVEGPNGPRIFSLEGEDHSYRALVEAMNEGAATLGEDGTILYCNARFAEMLDAPLERVMGSAILRFLADRSQEAFEALVREASGGESRGELELVSRTNEVVPAHVSISVIHDDTRRHLCLVAADLRAQKRNEEIVVAERLARSVLDQAADAIIVCDERGHIIRASRSATKLCRCNPLLRPFDEVFAIELSAQAGQLSNLQEFHETSVAEAVLHGGVARGVPARLVLPDGTKADVLIGATALRGAGDRVEGCVINLVDVGDAKRAETELAASRDYLDSLLNAVGNPVFVKDGGHLWVLLNDAFCSFLGHSREELIGRSDFDFFPRDQAEVFWAKDDAVLRTGQADINEELFTDRMGRVRTILTRKTLYTSPRGEKFIVGIITDITERKRYEEELRTSETRLREIIEHAPIAMGIARLDGTIEYLNRKAVTTFGYGLEEIPNLECWWALAYPDPDYRREVVATWTELTEKALAEHREIEGREYRVTCKDGSVKTLLILGVPIAGKVFVMFDDVTERKQAEEVSLRNEAVLAQAGKMASLGAWWIDYHNLEDLNANPLHWSPETFRIFGYQPGEVEVTIAHFFERVHPDDRFRIEDAVAGALAARKPYSLEHRIIRPDGTERVVWEYGEGIFDDAGRPLRLIGAVQDVTERKRAEEILRETDRRRNEFLGVLSHELRNPLTPIRNSLYILERATPGGEQARRSHSVIDRQVSHLTRLVDDLLDVTRIGRGKVRLQRTRMDLVDAVRRTIEDHRTLLEDRELIVSLPDEAVWIDGDPARLVQVVGNLLNNAAKFTPVDTEVSVSLAEAGDWAVLEVVDTGVGIDPETLKRLFEPFAQEDRSLDRSRGGLGLGLALVKGMVELHGGEVSAHSDGPGRGARFTVKLPLSRGAVAQPSSAGQEAGTRGRKVLIIEDNKDAADSLSEALGLAGHEVIVAYDGDAGLAAARELRPEIVLCDIGLPGGTDGYAVAGALRNETRTASTYLVALTGYAQPEDQRHALEAGFNAHLAKPPDLAGLERLLARVPHPGA